MCVCVHKNARTHFDCHHLTVGSALCLEPAGSSAEATDTGGQFPVLVIQLGALHGPLCCMFSHFSCVRLFVTPWTVARQAPLSVGFSRQEYWSRLPLPSLRDLVKPELQPASTSLALQADSLPLRHWAWRLTALKSSF